jgi:hypothetical protein
MLMKYLASRFYFVYFICNNKNHAHSATEKYNQSTPIETRNPRDRGFMRQWVFSIVAISQ